MTTKIEWTDETWNPITGCTKISEGCQNCYANRMAKRLAGRFGYPQVDPFQPGNWRGHHRVAGGGFLIDEPFAWRRSKRVFVCSMGDLFHDAIPDVDIWRVIEVCYLAESHIFQILTKRPERMRDMLTRSAWWINDTPSNIWLGVTAENQVRADERIPVLLDIPAAVRFVSVEPMLGKIDIMQYLRCEWIDCMNLAFPRRARELEIDWVICGAETGPGKRGMAIEWARSLRTQCMIAGKPFFFKKDTSGSHELDGLTWELFPGERGL